MKKLKEFKIKVTPEQSKIVQETLFKEGYYWEDVGSCVSYLDKPYLFINTNMSLTHTNDINLFDKHRFPEITFKDFYKMFIYDISNVSLKDCIDKKNVSPYFKNIEDMKEVLEYDRHICMSDGFIAKKYYQLVGLEYPSIQCGITKCSECPFDKRNKEILKEMLPQLKEKEDMKHELKIPWVVRNDGSQLFIDTVIKYLNNHDYQDLRGGKDWVEYYYGIDNNNKIYSSHITRLDKIMTIYSLEEFIKLTNMEKDKKIIGYKLKEDCKQYEKAVKILADQYEINWWDRYANENIKKFGYNFNLYVCPIFVKAGVLTLWFEPVYEKIEKNIILEFNDIKFSINKDKEWYDTLYGSITLDELNTAINYLQNPPALAGYELTIHLEHKYSKISHIAKQEQTNFKIGFGCKQLSLNNLIELRDTLLNYINKK